MFDNQKTFDIHSHLNFRDFNEDREEIIKRMQDKNIWTICVGADYKTSQECVDLAEKNANIFASVGLHPSEKKEDFIIGYYRKLASSPKVVAIGEIGLDYRGITNFDSQNLKKIIKNQKDLFIKQIELAVELNKPLMIHCRDAHQDLIEILKNQNFKFQKKLKGNIHFFSGGWEQAKIYFYLGFSISFAGPITFTGQYDEVIKNAPIDKIMIETDSPFAAPIPYRGRRNEPFYVVEVAKKIAKIKKMTTEEVVYRTAVNAMEFFGL